MCSPRRRLAVPPPPPTFPKATSATLTDSQEYGAGALRSTSETHAQFTVPFHRSRSPSSSSLASPAAVISWTRNYGWLARLFQPVLHRLVTLSKAWKARHLTSACHVAARDTQSRKPHTALDYAIGDQHRQTTPMLQLMPP